MTDEDRHAEILSRAASIFAQRQEQYGDQWKQYGWRGCLYNARRKAERAWRTLWNAKPDMVEVTAFQDREPHLVPGTMPDTDDLYDLINYAAMAIMAVADNNRDGTFWDGV